MKNLHKVLFYLRTFVKVLAAIGCLLAGISVIVILLADAEHWTVQSTIDMAITLTVFFVCFAVFASTKRY